MLALSESCILSLKNVETDVLSLSDKRVLLSSYSDADVLVLVDRYALSLPDVLALSNINVL